MNTATIQSIRAQCRPLQPRPTQLAPRLTQLKGVRAVLFDIYGTLMISASGDIGADSGNHRATAIHDVAALFDIELNCSSKVAIETFEQTIHHAHQSAKDSGIVYPEVDIREIWQKTLGAIGDVSETAIDFSSFAVEYELRVNPTWPMPGASATLNGLHDRGLVMGIVSNAQFFTPMLFPALLNEAIEDYGISPSLTYFSYMHRQAKPGAYLYDAAKQQLALDDIAAEEVLYVGNDMLNDVTAAASVGFRTALFGGDQRSLRLRSDDDRVHGVEADIVVTELPQLFDCLSTI